MISYVVLKMKRVTKLFKEGKFVILIMYSVVLSAGDVKVNLVI